MQAAYAQARLIPPACSAPLANAVDQLLLEATQQLFGIALDASQAAQSKWRIDDGGLDLRGGGGVFTSAAWLASRAQVYSIVESGSAWEISAEIDQLGETIWTGSKPTSRVQAVHSIPQSHSWF